MQIYSSLTIATVLFGFSAQGLNLQQFQTQMTKQVEALDHRTTSAVQMEVLGSGNTIFSYNSNMDFVPASSSKLMTTSATLEQVGADFTFVTKALQVNSDLVLVGSGDPNLQSNDYVSLAHDIVSAGFRHIHSIRINNSAFKEDYDGLAAFADFDGETDASIVSATNLNYNLLQVFVTPQAKSSLPEVTVGPVNNNYAIIRNQAKQVSGSSSDLNLTPFGLSNNRETFILTGTIGLNAGKVEVDVAVRSPESHAAFAMAGILRQMGVTVDQDFGGTDWNPPPSSARVLSTHRSLTLTQLADIYMPDSINFMAEQVFQLFGRAVLGAPASIEQSQMAMRSFMNRVGGCQTAKMENGSGLTWNNAISPVCFLNGLQALYRDGRIYDDLIASLPVGGKTGTLKYRFTHPPSGFVASRVHAKTGTLWSKKAVSSLIGVSPSGSGQMILFALIENDQRNEASVLHPLKEWEDACVELIQQLHF